MSTLKRFLPFILILILLLIIKNNLSSIIASIEKGSTTKNLEKALFNEKKENLYLKEHLYYVKTDKFVADEAQNKLGMLREGEFFVIAPTASPKNSQAEVFDDKPNWKKWWELFF